MKKTSVLVALFCAAVLHAEDVKTEVDPALNKPVTSAATAQDAENSNQLTT